MPSVPKWRGLVPAAWDSLLRLGLLHMAAIYGSTTTVSLLFQGALDCGAGSAGCDMAGGGSSGGAAGSASVGISCTASGAGASGPADVAITGGGVTLPILARIIRCRLRSRTFGCA